jgi:Domain of Unknown Function (DUF748)
MRSRHSSLSSSDIVESVARTRVRSALTPGVWLRAMTLLRTAIVLFAAGLLWAGGALYLLAPTVAVYGLAHLADLDPDGLSVDQFQWNDSGFTLSGLSVSDTKGVRLLHLESLNVAPDWHRLVGDERAFAAFRLTGLTVFSGEAGQSPLVLERIDLENVLLDLRVPAVRVEAMRIAQGEVTIALDDAGAPSVWRSTLAALPWQESGAAVPWRWSIDLARVEVSEVRARFDDPGRPERLRVEAALTRASFQLSGTLWDSPSIALETGTLTGSEIRIEQIAALRGDDAVPVLLFEDLGLDAVDVDWPRGRLAVVGFDGRLTDRSQGIPLTVEVGSGSLSVMPVGTDEDYRADLAFVLPLVSGGRVEGGGTLGSDSLDVNLDVRELSLKPLAPWVRQRFDVSLEDARLGLDVAVGLTRGPELAATVSGDASVQGLELKDDAGAPLIAWERLDSRGLEYDSANRRFRVREVDIRAPFLRVVVNPDRTTNLSRYMSAQQPSALRTRLDRVRISRGIIDFTDLGLVLPLTVRIEALGGNLRGIDADPTTRATLSITGEVGADGLAAIEGQFAALADSEASGFSEFELTFRQVDLLPLSPYFATFAGRRVDGGTLDLNLDYRVRAGQLEGSSHAVLQHLRLGERIESQSAFDLPLDLAVALLTDAEGRIDVEMPLTGRVDQPGFGYGRMIRRALGRMLKDTVTAPFRALARLLGERFAAAPAIRFSSGSAQLLRSERTQVDALVATLAQRPELALRIRTGVNAERDALALRRLAVRRAHATHLGVTLAPDEDPGPIAFEDAASQAALAAMLDARRGPGAAAALLESANADKADDSVALPIAERYRRVYRMLVDSTTLADAELNALAAARGQAIASEFVSRGVPLEQVLVIPANDLTPAKPSGVQVPLEAAPVERSR